MVLNFAKNLLARFEQAPTPVVAGRKTRAAYPPADQPGPLLHLLTYELAIL